MRRSAARANRQARPRTAPGFTLIELLVVLAIVALLLSISAPRYFRSIDTAKEIILVENLRLTRETIDKFFADTGRYPASLEELVEKHYLRALPFDPVADSNATWRLELQESAESNNVVDLRSGAPGQTRDGRPFSEL